MLSTIAGSAILLASTAGVANACGPFFKTAVFSHTLHPDFPLTRFAQGELGIIRPGFARSYLVVAYRALTGCKMTPTMQKECNDLWRHRLDVGDQDVQDAANAWLAARKLVPAVPVPKNMDVYSFLYGGGYMRYTPGALKTATETLKSKVAKYGANDERVKDWARAQDEIFNLASYDAKKGEVKELPASADAESRADRAYQIACEQFYDGKFDDAADKFAAIGKDPNSPWQKYGLYLSARALCRKATLSTAGLSRDDLKKADAILQEVIKQKELKELNAAALRLQSFIRYRLEPNERLTELAARLADKGEVVAFRSAVDDYTKLLDRCPGTQEDKNQQNQQPTSWYQHGSKSAGGELARDVVYPGAALLVILLVLGLGRFGGAGGGRSKGWHSLVSGACLLTAPLLIWSCTSTGSSHSTAAQTPTAETTTPEAASALDVDTPTDEMSRWIMNFQSKAPKALDDAYTQWKKDSSLPWFISAISKVNATDQRSQEILAESAKIASNSPAYLTVAFHRARLLKQLGKNAQALDVINAALAKGDAMPPSSRNDLFDQELDICKTLDDFAKLVAPSPAAISWDYDSAEMPEPIEDLAKAEKSNQYLKTPASLMPDAALVINTMSPLSVFERLLQKQELPKQVRQDLAQAAWVRAALLKNARSASALSAVLITFHPELKAALASYENASSPEEKEFLAASIVLANPAMRPYVTAGLPRETPFSKIDSYRDNWWGTEAPQPQNPYSDSGEKPSAPRLHNPAFLSGEEQKAAASEYGKLKALGTAPNFLAKTIIAWGKSHPKDPRLPEALHNAVRATRYGATDDATSALSKQAFKALHDNFPGNPWTKKTPYYF